MPTISYSALDEQREAYRRGIFTEEDQQQNVEAASFSKHELLNWINGLPTEVTHIKVLLIKEGPVISMAMAGGKEVIENEHTGVRRIEDLSGWKADLPCPPNCVHSGEVLKKQFIITEP